MEYKHRPQLRPEDKSIVPVATFSKSTRRRGYLPWRTRLHNCGESYNIEQYVNQALVYYRGYMSGQLSDSKVESKTQT